MIDIHLFPAPITVIAAQEALELTERIRAGSLTACNYDKKGRIILEEEEE